MHRQRLIFQFFLLLGIESSETMKKEWESDYRLPQTTLPLHYDLYLFPNLKDDTFSGHVAISLDTKEPRNHFVVHVKNLKVSDTQLKVLEQFYKQTSFTYLVIAGTVQSCKNWLGKT